MLSAVLSWEQVGGSGMTAQIEQFLRAVRLISGCNAVVVVLLGDSGWLHDRQASTG